MTKVWQQQPSSPPLRERKELLPLLKEIKYDLLESGIETKISKNINEDVFKKFSFGYFSHSDFPPAFCNHSFCISVLYVLYDTFILYHI